MSGYLTSLFSLSSLKLSGIKAKSLLFASPVSQLSLGIQLGPCKSYDQALDFTYH